LIRVSDNLGCAGGMNVGIHFAYELMKAKEVLLLNNDVVLEPDFLEQMMSFTRANPEIAISQGKILFYNDRKRLNSAGNMMDRFGGVDCRGFGELDTGQYDGLISTGFFYASGAAMLVRDCYLRSCEAGSYLDSTLFAYHEDLDISWSARMLGYAIGFCPKAVCYHKGGRSLKEDRSLTVAFYVKRNIFRVLLKNYELRNLFFSLPLAVVIASISSGAHAANRRNLSYLVVFVRALLWNLRNLDDTLRERRVVQARRIKPDRAIIPYMAPGSILLAEMAKRLRKFGSSSKGHDTA
jgi:GT2 family glycosyltransferase